VRPVDYQRDTAKMILRELVASEALYQRDQLALIAALAALDPPTAREIDAFVDEHKLDQHSVERTVKHFLGAAKP
jgi:hypothetical protein